MFFFCEIYSVIARYLSFCFYLFVCLSVCLSPARLSVRKFILLFVFQIINLCFVCLSVWLSVYMPVCQSDSSFYFVMFCIYNATDHVHILFTNTFLVLCDSIFTRKRLSLDVILPILKTLIYMLYFIIIFLAFIILCTLVIHPSPHAVIVG